MLQLQQLMHKTILTLVSSALLTLSSVTVADISMPDVAKPKGDKCVAPTAEMRVTHFEKVFHQRDETMHQGIRTKTHSLKECINCHVPENTSVRFNTTNGDKKHFCSACHIEVGVTIDCFQCHADRPGNIPERHKLYQAKKSNTSLHAEPAVNSTEPAATGAAP